MEEDGKDSIQKKMFKNFILCELKEKGIDITQNDYIKNPAFIKLKNEFVIEDEISVTKSWWIEENIVGQERLKRIYGKYALGIEHTFSLRELDDNIWIKDLVDALGQDDLDEYAIKRYFYRNEKDKLGLVYRLQKLGFDIQKFDNCAEKVKLLFFLCCFEKKQRIEMIPFLSNPTLENVDNSIVGDITRNGELIFDIKMNVQKEVSTKYIKDCKQELGKVGLQWQHMIENVLLLLDMAAAHQPEAYRKELKRIEIQTEYVLGMFKEKRIISYKDSVLETFYLKILQHESIGREKDIINIEELKRSNLDDLETDWLEQYKKTLFQIVTVDRIKDYIKDKRKDLARLVFRKKLITSNDYKKFDVAVEKIDLYFDMLENNTGRRREHGFSVLTVISFIQETVELYNKEKIDNDFYRYNTGDLKTLNSELHNGKVAFRKNQIALIERVRYRQNYNLGMVEEYNITNRIITNLDYLLTKIYQVDSLENMRCLNSYLLMFVNAVLTSSDIIDNRFERFSNIVTMGMGYKVIADELEKRFFLGILGGMSIFNKVERQINEFLKAAESKDGRLETVWVIDIKTIPYICLKGYAYFGVALTQKALILNNLSFGAKDNTRLILLQEGWATNIYFE